MTITEIVNAAELFYIDGSEVSDRNELAEWIAGNECLIEESNWRPEDTAAWPSMADRANRRIVILLPTVDGQRVPDRELVVVIG